MDTSLSEADDPTMETVEDAEELNSRANISAVPEEILELIFGYLSPYGDMKNVMLVCKQWYRVVSDLIVKLHRNFHQMLRSNQMAWSFISSDHAPSITDRYSHSACYFEKSMYVFGGCSATSTTFNDLWRFDLTTRQWVRPLAMGTYPSPKACASMVVYKDSLVLYGGWSRPTPMPLHQAPRYFSELHMYTPSTNRWSQIMAVSNDALHRVAGHSVSILGDTMVVFGGSHDPGSGCNEVWLFDFEELVWKKPVITGKKPNPRYGQSQATLDEEHILIIGGCGGPNQMFSDVWLLHLIGNSGVWEEVTVENTEFAPPALWCHPACMVNDLAVFISKNSRVKGSNPEPHNMQLQQNRVWVPPQGNAAGPVANGANPDPPNVQQQNNRAWIPPQGNPAGGAAGIGAAPPHPPNPPHIPPPPPFPPMAAFQRRREDWGGFGMLGGMPALPREPPDIVQQPNFHGAQNPNIGDVQRLNLRSGQLRDLRGEPRLNLQGPQLPSPSVSPRLQPQGADEAGPSRQGVQSTSSPNTSGGGSVSNSDERPGPSNADLAEGSGPSNGAASDSHRPGSGISNSPAVDRDADPNPNPEAQGAHALRPGFPSVRPNAMHNRQRQLDMLRKHENLLRSRNSNNSQNRGSSSRLDYLPRNPMVIHILDFSGVVTTKTATWLPVRDTPIPGAPEETIFYSLVEGRGELLLFGGIQRDQNPMQRVNSPPDSASHFVSSSLYMITPKLLNQL